MVKKLHHANGEVGAVLPLCKAMALTIVVQHPHRFVQPAYGYIVLYTLVPWHSTIRIVVHH